MATSLDVSSEELARREVDRVLDRSEELVRASNVLGMAQVIEHTGDRKLGIDGAEHAQKTGQRKEVQALRKEAMGGHALDIGSEGRPLGQSPNKIFAVADDKPSLLKSEVPTWDDTDSGGRQVRGHGYWGCEGELFLFLEGLRGQTTSPTDIQLDLFGGLGDAPAAHLDLLVQSRDTLRLAARWLPK